VFQAVLLLPQDLLEKVQILAFSLRTWLTTTLAQCLPEGLFPPQVAETLRLATFDEMLADKLAVGLSGQFDVVISLQLYLSLEAANVALPEELLEIGVSQGLLGREAFTAAETKQVQK
jgi:hypothetical protein